MSMDLAGRNIVITGGTGGLGTGVVQTLVDAGAHCYIADYSHVTEEQYPLLAHERVTVCGGVDLTDDASAAGFFAGVPELWASVHLVGGFAMGSLSATSAADMRKMFELNLITCFLSCQHGAANIQRHGGGGRIVNVIARPVLEPVGGMLAYTTSKAAVASLTQCVAEELKSESILVNAIVPSIIDTPANRVSMPEADHASWPTVRDLANVISFLVSPANRVTSGTLVPVYGAA